MKNISIELKNKIETIEEYKTFGNFVEHNVFVKMRDGIDEPLWDIAEILDSIDTALGRASRI